MTSIRDQIHQILLLHQGDLAEAAIAVCIQLDDQLGLSGNGWFDDDMVMLERLELPDAADSATEQLEELVPSRSMLDAVLQNSTTRFDVTATPQNVSDEELELRRAYATALVERMFGGDDAAQSAAELSE